MRTMAVLSLLLGACVGEIAGGSRGGPPGDSDASSADAPASTDAAGSVLPDAPPGAPDAAPGSPDAAPADASTDPDPAARICARWNADRASLGEGTWSGNVASCVAGDVSADGRASALRLVNLYRFLAGLPAVTTDPALDAKAQQCALMMDANDALDHAPPTSWRCYTADGASAAGSSNIATTRGVTAVDLYMVDPGNPTTMGHRRWILSNGLGPIGLGTTSGSSCMWVFGGRGGQDRPWTAWPPPGPFPFGAVKPSFQSIDQTGWTIQSSAIDLRSATVTVTSAGQPMPVTTTVLAANFGSRHALSFIPQGWTTRAGATYHVEVTGGSQPIAYDVEVVDCD
jgi:uncharacterized protein YkwD